MSFRNLLQTATAFALLWHSGQALSVTEQFKPLILFSPGDHSATKEEAFAAAVQEMNICGDSGCRVLSDQHDCAFKDENYHVVVWGILENSCGVLSYYNKAGELTGTLETVATGLQQHCPAGYPLVENIITHGGPGERDVEEDYCQGSSSSPDPRACERDGNPILRVDGSKEQIAVDFEDPYGTLTIQRKYSSNTGRFEFSFWSDFLPPRNGNSRLGQSGGCKLLKLNDGSTACFESLPAFDKISHTSAIGTTFSYNWLNGIGTPNEAYNQNQIFTKNIGESVWHVLKSEQGEIVSFSASGRLLARAYKDGRRADFHYSPTTGLLESVTDGRGRSMSLSYESGVLKSIREVGGEPIEYQVNAPTPGGQGFQPAAPLNPIINSVRWSNGDTVQYLWNEPGYATGLSSKQLLTGIIDEKNGRFATFLYSNGVATQTYHANGVDKYQVAGRSGRAYVDVTDPLNNVVTTTYQNIFVDSMPNKHSQPGGSGCEPATSEISYDSRYNPKRRIDFNGNMSCHAYAPGRNVELYRLEGLSSSTPQICDGDIAAYQVASNKPQRKISMLWHPTWKLEVRRAEPKLITTTVYNGMDDPITQESGVVCAPGAPALPDDSKIAVVCRRYEQATADETGNQGFTAARLETRKWTYTYNQYGQVVTETDPRGQTSGKKTTYEYWAQSSFPDGVSGHTLGDLKTMTNAAGLDTQYLSYNKRGQPLTIRYANGSQELREYHARGWLTKVSLRPVDAVNASRDQVTQYEYHPTGQLKTATQPDGSTATYTWDPAHRLTDVVDSMGNKVHYELDNAGNRISEQFWDPSNHLAKTMSRTFDTLGRMKSSTGLQ